MPESTDLVGLGMPAILAAVMGNDDLICNCAGTSQTTATLIRTNNVELVAGASQTGAILNSASLLGTPVYCFCSSSTSAVVYVPVGHTLNGSLNGSLTIAQNKAAFLYQYKKNFWGSVLSA